MAEKPTQKGKSRRGAKIDEDNDVFLSFINKKKRAGKKKLTEIEELEKRDQSTLKPEQRQKIMGKPEISKQNDYWHEIKDLYYQALKANQEEGGKKQPLKKEGPAPTQEKVQETQKQTTKEQPCEKTKTDAVRPLLNLLHVNGLFSNAAVREEFDKGYLNMSGSLGLTTIPDFKAIHDFAHKVLSCGEGNQNAGKRLDDAVKHAEHFVDCSSDVAAGDKTYAHLSSVVCKLAGSDFFRQHKTVHHAQREEHKQEHKQEHKHEPKHEPKHEVKHEPKHEVVTKHEPTTKHEPKHSSPVKTQPHHDTKKEETQVHSSKKETPTTTTTYHVKETKDTKDTKETQRSPQENTDDWGEFDDDDYNEDGYDEEEEEVVETKKTTVKKIEDPNEGFIEVKSRKDIKAGENPQGGRGGRGSGRRGNRRGSRRGGEGWRGGEEGGERGGYRRRGGEGWRGGEEGGERGGYRRRRRGGNGEDGGERGGYRRRGKEEYVPKQEGGQSQTQP